MNGARKIVVDVDVTDCHLEGCRRIATDLFVPKMPLGEPVLWCCLPGGGASRAYFDLDVPRGAGEYSMARFAAERRPLKDALSKIETRLLALVGMMALIPGSMKPELERIKVPTLVAMGDRDIAGSVAALPVQLPECRDLTLLILPNTGHNHNRYDSRFRLWTRLLGWTDGLTAFTGE